MGCSKALLCLQNAWGFASHTCYADSGSIVWETGREEKFEDLAGCRMVLKTKSTDTSQG